jgi:DNA-binding MarR family transcriptional regulator
MTTDARASLSIGRHDLGLLDSLVRLSFAVQEVLERVADGHDLSLVQARLLGILRDREPAMMELARFLNLDKSSVTGLVTRSERRGLVERTTRPDDRRAVHVALTAKGRELAQRFAKQVERDLAVLVEDLSEVDRKRLSVLASQIALGEAQRRLLGSTVLPRRP